MGAGQLPGRVGHAALVLQYEDLFLREVQHPSAQRLVVETSDDPVLISLLREPAAVASLVGQAGTEAVDRIAQENQQASARGSLSEERRDPWEVEVVGRPLSRQPAGWTGEPLVVQRAFRRAERVGCIPAKEMALLVDIVSGVDVRMCAHSVVPPGGAGL